MRFQDIETVYNPHNGADHDWQYLEEWLRKAQELGLNLDPDFQRGHVWTEAQQIAYVENVLRDGMAGRTIFINRGPWCWRSKADNKLRIGSPANDSDASWQGYHQYVLVDGKQRLTAILRFLRNEIPAFGHFRCEYTDRLPSQAQVRIAFGEFRKRADILSWYLDLNAGGVVHSEDEIERVRGLLRDELGK